MLGAVAPHNPRWQQDRKKRAFESHARGKDWEKKYGDETVLQCLQAISIFSPVIGVWITVFTVKYNHSTALHTCWQQQGICIQCCQLSPKESRYSVLKHDLMMSWAHLHMNKIADQEQIEAELSSRHSLISPAGLLCPTVMKPLSLCVQYRDTRSAVQGEGWLIRTIWKEQAISQNIYESGLVTSLLPNVWKSDVFPW